MQHYQVLVRWILIRGQFSGFDIDYCRGIAAAVEVDDIEFIALTAGERFTALQTGQIDVLIRNTHAYAHERFPRSRCGFCPDNIL